VALVLNWLSYLKKLKETFQFHNQCHLSPSGIRKVVKDGEEDFNALNMPVSPAFVNSQKEKEPKLKKQLDECLLKNIPFCAEEDKYYRFR